MSAADLMAVLAANHLRYDLDDPRNSGNDHLVFSKGHASPLLYALYHAAGAIDDAELLTFRQQDSRLEGHPTPRLPWVDVATGSLGQGLPIGVGLALAAKRLDQLRCRVWVLCGDSELAEGSMWEAFEHAAYERLDNLIAIVDVNRLGQRGPTRHGWDTEAYANRIGGFGWRTIEIDGHDVTEIDRAYAEATESNGVPTVILARTKKGSGVTSVEDKEGQHGKPIADSEKAIRELGGERRIRIHLRPPDGTERPRRFATRAAEPPRYEVGEDVATRTAFGEALTALANVDPDIVGLDGEVADSTRLEYFAKAHPERFFECYIAEQQLLAAAIGMQARGWKPFVATFAAFLSRAYDFIRMAAIGRAELRLVGSHAGVAIGQDGPSQMGLEDLAAVRAVYGSTVLHPCDANQAAKLVTAMAETDGISYLRTSRGSAPVIYRPDDGFPIGGSRILRSSEEDQVCVVAAGTTVHEARAAADRLADDGLPIRVIDAYSVKPIDAPTIREAAERTGRLITVEDHWPQGGLGDAVLDIFADGRSRPRIVKLAVRSMPGSATPEEQLRAAGIDRIAITDTARALASTPAEASIGVP